MSRVRWWRRLVPPLLSAVVLTAGSVAAVQAAYPASSTSIDHRLQPALRRRREPRSSPRCRPPPRPPTPGSVMSPRTTPEPSSPGRRPSTGPPRTGATTSTATAITTGCRRRPALHRLPRGFRDCTQAVVFSKDIKAKRAGRQSNLVFVSTCHAADANTTLPDAFAIAKTKSSGGATRVRSSTSATSGSSGTATSGSSSSGSGTPSPAARRSGPRSTSRCSALQRSRLRRRLVGHVLWSGVAGPWTTCKMCS